MALFAPRGGSDETYEGRRRVDAQGEGEA